MTDKQIAYEPHPVTPERKAELVAAGFKIIDAVYAPKEPAHYGTIAGARAYAEGLGTDSGDQFSDEQLRAIIKDATGKAPHHKLSREKLIAMFNELNAAE